MNWDQIEGKWKEMTGKVQTQWGKLTDDDLETLGGSKDEVIGRIQERYGWEREKAEMEVNDFFNRHSSPSA